MKRAVAFCNSIKSSKQFTDEFTKVYREYLTNNPYTKHIDCETEHVDGTMNATKKGEKLSWLKADTEDKCRILSNARCLSEGVDVPSLDAVMFIHGKRSMVDIVQSVGRVMRKAPGKKLGYIIIPVGVPQGQDASAALANSKDYKVVWDIINALRSHDDRLDASINRVALTDDPLSKIEAIIDKIEIIAKIEDFPAKSTHKSSGLGIGSGDEEYESHIKDDIEHQMAIALSNDSVQQGILAKLVDKCGTRTYWEDWAKDIAKIAQKHITRIKAVLSDKDSDAYKKFKLFVNDLKQNTNDAVTDDEVVEMLAQHIITQPIFKALFEGYDFSKHNSMSKSGRLHEI
jgi:predicted helicase